MDWGDYAQKDLEVNRRGGDGGECGVLILIPKMFRVVESPKVLVTLTTTVVYS